MVSKRQLVIVGQGNLPTPFFILFGVVTTPVQFGYYAILVEVDSPRRVIWPEREGRRKKEEGRRKKEEGKEGRRKEEEERKD